VSERLTPVSTELPRVNSALPIIDLSQATTQTELPRVRTTGQFVDQAQAITLTELPREKTTGSLAFRDCVRVRMEHVTTPNPVEVVARVVLADGSQFDSAAVLV